jgi:hypothetical protein
MSARTIPKNFRNITGIAANEKAKGRAGFESTLERDFLTLLEFSPEVNSFEVQPVTIEWKDANGKARKYTPDVLVRHDKSSPWTATLYEVKYRSDIAKHWDELKPKFRQAISFAKKRSWRFKIASEVEIRTPYLQNARFLLPFQFQGPGEVEHMDMLDSALKRVGEASPRQLLGMIFKDDWNQAKLLPTLWYLVASRQIACDLSVPLNMETPLRFLP